MVRKVIFSIDSLPNIDCVINCDKQQDNCPALSHIDNIQIKHTDKVTDDNKSVVLNILPKKVKDLTTLTTIQSICRNCKENQR